MLKGEKDLLTLQIKGDGPIGAIIVTADSKGNVKGYVHEPNVLLHANAKGKLDVSGAIGHGELCIIRDTGLKDPYVGRTNLVSGEIAEDLTYYYAVSEQTPSSVGLGVLMSKDNHVKQAGGMIIQLLPGASEELITALEQKLSEITSITTLLEAGMTPEDILGQILGDFGLDIMDKMPAQFYCNCSKERVEKAVISIGEKDLKELIAEGEDIEVNCHFCNTHYIFTPDELRGLLERQ
jgi:molecular chaperone Hsp33